MLIKYPKIETPFLREENGSKKLRPWAYRNNLVKYLANNMWIFTEKIDGTNVRVYWDGHTITFHGRTDRAQLPRPLQEYLYNTFSTNEMEEMFEQIFGEKEVILFGEGYGPKIQNGGAYRDNVSFILFDVWVSGYWLSWNDVRDVGKKLGIDIVPFIYSTTLTSAIKDIAYEEYPSKLGTAKMEGMVGRPAVPVYDAKGERVTVKLKWCDFKDIDLEVKPFDFS